MLPDLSLLVGLVLGLQIFQGAGDSSPDPLRAAGGTLAILLVVAALCRMAADRAIRALEEGEPEEAIAAGGRMVFLPLLGWLAALLLFDWAAFVAAAVPKSWFLVPYLALFFPLFALFASTWTASRRVEARISPAAPSAWGAVKRGLRKNILVLVPLLALLSLADLVTLLDAWDVPGVRTMRAWHTAYPDVESGLTLVLLVLLSLFAPALFRRAMKASPIEPGETRRALEALAEKIGLRCRDFLLWKTNGRIVNAMVVGMTPGTRYVFLTDGLLETMSLPEVVAVVAHEAGHARKNHLATYFVVALALFLLWRSAIEVILPFTGEAGGFALMAAFLGLFWFGVLGWLSRRFERQADAYAADNASALEPNAPAIAVAGFDVPIPAGAAVMIAVLRRLEKTVGPSRHHRHAPPRARTDFIAAYAVDPAVREDFRRDSRRIFLGIAGIVVLALAGTVARIPLALARGEATLRFSEGIDANAAADEARRRGDDAAALEQYRRSRAMFRESEAVLARRASDPILVLSAAASALNAASLDLRRLSDPAAAKAGYERALRLVEGSRDPRAVEVRFDAHIDLGLLALRGDDAAAGAAAAKRQLDAARAVSEDDYSSPMRKARTRLLDAAIRLRSADPAEAEDARRNLSTQSRASGEEWDELREDAKEELKRAPGK